MANATKTVIPVIDSDTHCDVTEATWEYMLPEEQEFKPTTGYPTGQDASQFDRRYWIIDGKRKPRGVDDEKKDQLTGTTLGTRTLTDVKTRLEHMDAMGIQTQIIYPGLFDAEPATRPDVEIGIKRSYNRWLADGCAESGGRLRWICCPPMSDMDKALEELRFAKANGAVGILKKGDPEAGKWAPDPYFFPLYEEAQRLDLPICFHLGAGTPDFSPTREFNYGRFLRIKCAPVHGMYSLLLTGVPAQFPELRFGVIETTASWIPFVVYDLRRRLSRRDEVSIAPKFEYNVEEDLFAKNRVYVAIQVDEDLPMILRYIGEDNLLVGSDYGHHDPAKEPKFVDALQGRVDQGDLPSSAVKKILYDNPKAFYGV